MHQQQQLGYFFYLALQTALATKSNDDLQYLIHPNDH
jgi:hypothetical protein